MVGHESIGSGGVDITVEERARRVEEVMVAALGSSAWQALLFHLKQAYGLSLADLWNRPEEFGEALQGLLGSGARIIIRTLVNAIREGSVGETPLDLARAVQRAREEFTG